MDISVVLIILGLLVFCSHIFCELFKKTSIPSVLMLMLIGIVIGPLLHLVSPDDLGKVGSVFTTITLIVILFQSGTTLNIKDLKSCWKSASAVTVINFCIALAVGTVIGKYCLGLEWLHSVFLGAVLGGTSSAVVIPMVNQLKLGENAKTILYLESTLSDILCLVVALAMLGGISSGAVSISGIFAQMGMAMFFSIVLGVAIGSAWIFIMKRYLAHMANMMFTTFAMAFIIYGVAELLGLNGGMAILAYGITAGNIDSALPVKRRRVSIDASLSDSEKNFYSEIVFLFQTYFFVYIGISIRFNNIVSILTGLLFVVVVFLFRFLTTSVVKPKGMSERDMKMMNVLGPKGLVAAVLASLPLQYAMDYAGRPDASPAMTENLMQSGTVIQDAAYAIVFISIVLSSVLVALLDRRKDKEPA